ncbi:MAG: methylglyoxal synthase [Lachnospiraceae bacterium]|nr:methylglyoxal synthase [Lachnospiraceae bacterium]MDY5741683.1 methylglyoxal synthase [Lachnospiraceae bacterium]
MKIGFIAHTGKKDLMADFCVAYKRIIGQHSLYATAVTARRIEEATGLRVHALLPGDLGGDKQIMDMIERDDIDALVFFPNEDALMRRGQKPNLFRVIAACDRYSIPIAVNLATAESLVFGIANGDLEWREKK